MPNENQQELNGMPPKTPAAVVAEDILDLRDQMAKLREKLKTLKEKFASEMRVIQQSKIVVKGWNFEVDMVDKVTITKKKKDE